MTIRKAPTLNQISAVIAEDEPILRADLQSRLELLWPELQLVGQAANGMEALRVRPESFSRITELP
jgi:YesN/AraC family two-component response regulator